ncbi:MAG TPA: TolC family protein, partial [Pseudomonadaceae bacterium]|nr:TolC family protein [Pseudomonadaceae bacterium]
SLGAAIGSSAQSGADLFSSSTETWNYGPLISWSFPHLNGTFARIRQAEASVDAAMARFESAWLEALRETETALDGYQQSLQRQAALSDASTHSSEAARLAQVRFEAGQLNYLDVLQAELGAVAARSSLVAMDAELTALQVDLFLALGGGWGSQ